MKKHNFYDGRWDVIIKDKGGKILSEDLNIRNGLADEGEKLILDSFFRGQNTPAEFAVRLCNSTPTETSTLSSITDEILTGGWLAKQVERGPTGWPTIQQVGGDWQVISKDLTQLATGVDIGPFTCAYLATTTDNTGELIAFVILPGSRVVPVGGLLTVRMTITLS